MDPKTIPIYSFAADDERSIAFRTGPLKATSNYNATQPHRHNYYEVFFFRHGGGTHMIDFREYPIRTNSVHFVSPGQVHTLDREPGTEGYVIIFSRDFFYSNLASKDLLFELPFLNNSSFPVLYLEEASYTDVHGLMEEIGREHGGQQPDFDIIRSYLNVLLLKCRRLFGEVNAESEQPHPLVNKFRQLLEERFSSHHLVRDYARELSVSEKSLNEASKKALGKTASELIHERIILEAKRLLVHGGLSNKEIAYQLSFDDPSHFSKFFKAHAGLSPNEFKARSGK